MSLFSRNIRVLRERKGLKLADFEQYGIKTGTMSNYELGKTEPKMDVLMFFSKFFGMSLDNLLFEDMETYYVWQDNDQDINKVLEHESEKEDTGNSSPAFKPSIQAQHDRFQAQHSSPGQNTNLVTEQSREVELLTQFIKAQEALLNSKAELLQAKDDIIEGKDAVIAAKEAQLANITKRAEELTAQLNDLKKQHPSVSKGTASGAAVRK